MAVICAEPNTILVEKFVASPKEEVVKFLQGTITKIEDVQVDEDITADDDFVAESGIPGTMYS